MFVLFSLFFFKQKTAYEMRISDWSSDVCSSDLVWRCIPRCAAAMNAVAQSPQTSADERIAAALVARGRLKDADLGRARKLLAESDDSLTGLLGRLGLVSERDLADAVSEVLALPLVAARDCPDAPPPSIQLSTRFLKEHAICPVGEGEGWVEIVAAEPQDGYAAQAVAMATGRTVRGQNGRAACREREWQEV